MIYMKVLGKLKDAFMHLLVFILTVNKQENISILNVFRQEQVRKIDQNGHASCARTGGPEVNTQSNPKKEGRLTGVVVKVGDLRCSV